MSIPSESSTIDSVLVVMLINFHLPWKLGDEFKPKLESIVNSFWHEENARIDSTMTSIEEALYQTKNQSNQDPLNFPIRLTDKLSYVGSIVGNGEFPPTEQAYGVRNELMAQIDKELARLAMVKNEMIPAFNKLVREKSIDAIILKKS